MLASQRTAPARRSAWRAKLSGFSKVTLRLCFATLVTTVTKGKSQRRDMGGRCPIHSHRAAPRRMLIPTKQEQPRLTLGAPRLVQSTRPGVHRSPVGRRQLRTPWAGGRHRRSRAGLTCPTAAGALPRGHGQPVVRLPRWPVKRGLPTPPGQVARVAGASSHALLSLACWSRPGRFSVWRSVTTSGSRIPPRCRRHSLPLGLGLGQAGPAAFRLATAVGLGRAARLLATAVARTALPSAVRSRAAHRRAPDPARRATSARSPRRSTRPLWIST